MPTISVIVPVYKVENYIHRCVDSILAQTLQDFDLILVDDGSPDNCGIICDGYAEKDSRVVVIHQKNGGLSAARNAGIDWAFANSGSQWLSFIDSDDWVHPEYLQRLLDAAVENDVAVSICSYVETGGEETQISETDLIPQIWNPEDFYVEHNVNAIVAWGKLYRKNCFEDIRYPIGKLHEDIFVTYRILFDEHQIAVIPAPLYAYFQSPTSIMRSPWTPKRLDMLEGRYEQLLFFKVNGFYEAYTKSIFVLCWNIASDIKKIEREQKNVNMPHLKTLRKLLRKELKKNKRYIGFLQNRALYEVAYPQFMKYYWLWQVFLKKLHIRK